MEEAEITALVEPLRVHERRVQSEESVQRRLRARRHLDPRAARVVERIARRYDRVQASAAPRWKIVTGTGSVPAARAERSHGGSRKAGMPAAGERRHCLRAQGSG